MKLLGYLYLHAPDPENPDEYVTYRIAVESDEDPTLQTDEEANDESA